MIINIASLAAFTTGLKTSFNVAFAAAAPFYNKVAMTVPSSTREEKYGWMNQHTGLREWIGPRVITNLSVADYTIKNRRFEKTIALDRQDFEDDRIGVYAPFASEMGRAAAEHPDILVAELLNGGFTGLCYDGQPFFDADHPVGDGSDTGKVSVSNVQTGSGAPWFLFDTSRAVKPIIYQERIPPKFTALNQDSDDNVFMQDEYLYGIRARYNVGYGLWQMAFASKDDLTPANYEAARAAMMAFKGDGGRPLGINPNTLIVPPSLEGAAMRLLNNGTRVEMVDTTPIAIQNEWAKTATLIVTPWLA